MFFDKELMSESVIDVFNEEVFELDANVEECTFFAEADETMEGTSEAMLEIMLEAEQVFGEYTEKMMKCEAHAFLSEEDGAEILEEGASEFFKKIGDNIKLMAQRMWGAIKKFVATIRELASNDKKFVEKYDKILAGNVGKLKKWKSSKEMTAWKPKANIAGKAIAQIGKLEGTVAGMFNSRSAVPKVKAANKKLKEELTASKALKESMMKDFTKGKKVLGWGDVNLKDLGSVIMNYKDDEKAIYATGKSADRYFTSSIKFVNDMNKGSDKSDSASIVTSAIRQVASASLSIVNVTMGVLASRRSDYRSVYTSLAKEVKSSGKKKEDESILDRF